MSIGPDVGAGAAAKIRLSRAGAQWFDRVSGLNVLLDEVEIPPERWSRAPRYVSIALTNACELRCTFCYAPKTPGRLDAAAVLRWIEELDLAGCLGIGFGGGEPTAHPQFAKLCREAAQRTGMAITFTTHGHRVDEKLVEELRGNVHFVRVSVDGVGATYERIRGRSFASLRRQIQLVAMVAAFGLNVVVNDQTVDELDRVATFAADVGAVELLLLPEQPVGDRPGISEHTSRRLLEWVSATSCRLRLSVSRAGAHPQMPLADPFGDEPRLDAHAHIDANGILRATAYDLEGIPVGESILQSLEALRKRSTP